jgi:cellulose synthase/poly-beta-1,6-N-acetylglucosamine synthase-like glycosyltransferase
MIQGLPTLIAATHPIRETASRVIGVVVLPGIVELLALTLGGLRAPRGTPRRPRLPFKLAVVVPAHNEEKFIARCLQSVSSSAVIAGEKIHLLVVADNCTDRTEGFARESGAEVLIRENIECRGKGYALAYAFEKISREDFDGIFVIDADCVVSESTIGEVIEALAHGADAVQTRYEVYNSEESWRARLMSLALLGFTVIRPRGRHFWGLSAGIFGTGFALRRETLAKVPYLAYSIVEDIEFHIQLVRHRAKVAFLDRAAVYGQMPRGGSGVVSQRSRWEGGRIRLALRDALPLAKEVFRGRFRLLEPLLDLLTLPLAFQSACLVMLLASGLRNLQYLGLFGIAVLLLHVVASAFAGKYPLSALRTLAIVPFYILWKIAISPSILANARPNAHWVRTPRTDA